MTRFNETITVIATDKGVRRKGVVHPGEKFEVAIRAYSQSWMKPATKADAEKLDEILPEWLDFKAKKAVQLAQMEAARKQGKPELAEAIALAEERLEVVQREVKDLEALLASAEQTAAQEKKRADKAEADLAALNDKIDAAQKKSAATKTT
tara:strand:- start:608 stop:1060 length:453 start_codon:yes stop_codon:yes gene_type:complete